LELALGPRASRGLSARPAARRLFTQRRAARFRGDARRVALSRSTNRLTFGARVFLAHVLRAANRAFGLFAVHRAFGAFRLLALHLTFGTSADRVADGRAARVVTLPTANGMAILLAAWFLVGVEFHFGIHFGVGVDLRNRICLRVDFRFRCGHDRSEGENSENQQRGFHSRVKQKT